MNTQKEKSKKLKEYKIEWNKYIESLRIDDVVICRNKVECEKGNILKMV